MRKFVLTLFIYIGFTSVLYAQKRIIGGKSVDITQRPYMAEIFGRKEGDPYMHLGGGVILSDRWILTAAHVVINVDADISEVSTGNNNPDSDNNKSSIESIYIHPDYKKYESDYENDLALIKLSEPLKFDSRRQPINISRITKYPDNTVATISGWGRTSIDSPSLPTMLQTTDVVVNTISDGFLTSKSSTTYPFNGDSGAPLTISTPSGELVIGLDFSHLKDMSKGVETLYTNVGYYFDWISSYVYKYDIEGQDVVGTTGTFTVSPYDNFEVKVSWALDTVTKNGDKITVNGHGSGLGFINIYVNGKYVAHKYVWVGAPSVSGVVVDGDYLRLSKGLIDQHITQTEWNIDGSYYSYYEDWIYNPYANYGNVRNRKISVTVTASNQYGKSKPYSTVVTYSKGSRYNISQMEGTNTIRVLTNTASDFLTVETELTTGESETKYVLTNTKNGTVVKSGKLPPIGGIIQVDNAVKGMYVLKLYNKKESIETFKVSLK